jgi:hypothetical protein
MVKGTAISERGAKTIMALAAVATTGFLLACVNPPQRDWKETAAPGLYGLELWGPPDIKGEVGYPLFVNGPRAWCLPTRRFSGSVEIVSGRLPPGLNIDYGEGLHIRGIPTERGHWIVRIRYYDIHCNDKVYTGDTAELRFHITGSGRVHQ